MYRHKATVLTLVFLVDCIRVDRVLVVLFVDSNTAPPTVRSRGSSIPNFYFCLTTDTADASAGVFINLRKFVHLLYLQDKAR